MDYKNNKQYQTLCIEDIVKKMPMLTESDMNNMCTYEEIVNDALAMFDENVKKSYKHMIQIISVCYEILPLFGRLTSC